MRMACMARWLADCPAPDAITESVKKYCRKNIYVQRETPKLETNKTPTENHLRSRYKKQNFIASALATVYPKRNLGVTMHFSEKIKLQFGKDCHTCTLLCILKLLQILLINYLRKMCGYPRFSFWISLTYVKIFFSHIFSKLHKNVYESVGTVLN